MKILELFEQKNISYKMVDCSSDVFFSTLPTNMIQYFNCMGSDGVLAWCRLEFYCLGIIFCSYLDFRESFLGRSIEENSRCFFLVIYNCIGVY